MAIGGPELYGQSHVPDLRPYLIEETPTAVVGVSDLARSRHGRLFRHPIQTPPNDAPGSIALWHLWVPAAGTAGRA
jgi:hypothetical protein